MQDLLALPSARLGHGYYTHVFLSLEARGRESDDISQASPLTPHPSLLPMARWPRHTWTTFYTYAAVFLGFPLLCWLAYVWVHGWQ